MRVTCMEDTWRMTIFSVRTVGENRPTVRLKTGAISLNKNQNLGRAEFFAPPIRGSFAAHTPNILQTIPKENLYTKQV